MEFDPMNALRRIRRNRKDPAMNTSHQQCLLRCSRRQLLRWGWIEFCPRPPPPTGGTEGLAVSKDDTADSVLSLQ